MNNSSCLKRLQEELKSKISTGSETYSIPSIWLGKDLTQTENVKVNPYQYFSDVIDSIITDKKDGVNYNQSISRIHGEQRNFGGDWSANTVIYNIFTRLATAYDHNQDGVVGGSTKDITLNADDIRETGTFLKTIAILPYLKSLGIETIYLLPITSIGKYGNKGNLGSPYAIRNPYKIDERLADPLVSLNEEEQFKAFVEAAHVLGMRVVLEFIFRTASKDADWIKEKPEWYYWLDNAKASDYGSPYFSKKQLEELYKIPAGEGEYIAPSKEFRDKFTKPPAKENITDTGSALIGKLDDGTELSIAGAFADWPPDDIQPPWSDVTYLRMYHYDLEAENNFNYIAYNTIRYYDPQLATDENANTELWERIKNIIPHYQQDFGIDGVMIDMGHALPSALKRDMIKLAREIDHDFAFWDENFEVKKSSRDDGYNLVLGYTWTMEHEEGGFAKIVGNEGEHLAALSYFATPETHNTPRAASKTGGVAFSKAAWLFNCFLPAGTPFLHSGFELAETTPVNTGLGFTQEETEFYGSKPLPLFDVCSFDWLNKENIAEFVQKVIQLRNQYKSLVELKDPKSIQVLKSDNKNVVSYCRLHAEAISSAKLFIIINTDYENAQNVKITVPIELSLADTNLPDALSDKMVYCDKESTMSLNLAAGEIQLLHIEG